MFWRRENQLKLDVLYLWALKKILVAVVTEPTTFYVITVNIGILLKNPICRGTRRCKRF